MASPSLKNSGLDTISTNFLFFNFLRIFSILSPVVTGSVDLVDLKSGEITTVFHEYEGDHLCGPNDIVFDDSGGFWFTSLGKQRRREIEKAKGQRKQQEEQPSQQ